MVGKKRISAQIRSTEVISQEEDQKKEKVLESLPHPQRITPRERTKLEAADAFRCVIT